MELDRTTALCYFLRFLAGNPDGDAATRALVLGALAPMGVLSATLYAHDSESTLELVGNHGVDEELAAGYRVIPVNMPMPPAEAFVTMNAVVVPERELTTRYPLLSAEPQLSDGTALNAGKGTLIFAPILNSGVAIGVVCFLQAEHQDWQPADWQYLDGITAGLSMWLNNQREILVDRWRRSAPATQREVRISERQREILELVGLDRTNGEIAKSLGYSVPTIKKDLQQLMKLLGTHDRRSTAGRAREIGLLPERRGRE
jgi:DNA-binding CsgD family transcriptional regulator